jgi:hypothetical protein
MKEEEKTKIEEEATGTPPVVHVEEKIQEKSSWMAKKTFILILLLVAITIGLLAVALLPGIKSSMVKTPTTTQDLNFAQTELSLSTPVSATPNNYSTDVLISSGNNKTTAVQLEISYDPKVLTNVDIKPSTFFNSPVILLKNIDTVNGRISYALAYDPSQTAVGGNGTVATITFSTIAGTTTTQTTIDFEPKTAATAIGYAESVLKQTTGISFSPVIPTP